MLLATNQFAREVDHAMLLVCGVSVVLLVGITAVMVYFAVKFHRSRAQVTSQTGGHHVLEIVWTIIPTVIVIWMFYVGYEGFLIMRDPPEPDLRVEVTGKKWAWSFHYPEEKIDSTILYVPVKAAVYLDLAAPGDDVIHSFYIPEFRVKEDVRPGQKSWMWFQPEEEGTFHVFCAEFCGKDHSKMITTLKVVSEKEYKDWVRTEKARRLRPVNLAELTSPATDPTNELSDAKLLETAKPLYQTFCTSCHGAEGDGSGLPGLARNFKTLEGWKKGPRVSDIYRTLAQGVPGTQMRAYPNLSPWEKVALAKYVRTFNTGAPADTEEDYKALIAEFSLDKAQAPKETIPVEKAMQILARENGGS